MIFGAKQENDCVFYPSCPTHALPTSYRIVLMLDHSSKCLCLLSRWKMVHHLQNITSADKENGKRVGDDFAVGIIECSGFDFDRSTFESTLSTEWNIICDDAYQLSFSQSVYFGGMMIGVFVAGILSDKFGRKRVLITSVLGFSVAGILSAFSTSFSIFLLCRFFVAAGSSGKFHGTLP